MQIIYKLSFGKSETLSGIKRIKQNEALMTKLSIIFPVYNVEKYIHPSLESIFKQGLEDANFEVIIVNDGSTDRSMEMIADIIQQHNNIIVINQENQGLSVARNNGIAKARGEYFFMPDSDDLLIYNSLPFLLEQALSSRADMVIADFIKLYDEEIDRLQIDSIKHKEARIIEKTGKEMLVEDLSPYECYVWRTLYRRQFIIDNHITFTPGILYQDVPFTHECYLKAHKCIKTNWLLNLYRKRRKGSATYSFNMKKANDFCVVIRETWELTRLEGLSPQVLRKIQDDAFTTFSVMLWSTSHAIKKSSDRIKVIECLKREAPDLDFKNGWKQRVSSFMLKKMPHIFIRCRYLYDVFIEDKLLTFFRHKIKPIISNNNGNKN